jgi:UDP:flavonoid glycosyltransferase YjiC (YdhE family)
MRVLMTSWAWATHYTPLVPVMWALRAAGHDVRVASQPALTDVITHSGGVAVPVGPDLDHGEVRQRVMGDLALTAVPSAPPPGHSTAGWDPGAIARLRRVFGVFVAYAEAMADELGEFARDWRPDLIVYDPTTYAAPLIGAALSIPAVRHVHGVDITYQAREVAADLLAPLAARWGVASPAILGEATIDPCPPSVQTPANVMRIPVRFVPYNGPAAMPDWLRAAPARCQHRICVTWGTSTTRLAGASTFLAPRVIAAARELDAEIVVALAAHDVAALGDVPESVRVVESLPLHLLLPTCDAVVHQGGNGTLLTAALYGVPQLILPQLPDQRFHTDRLLATGAAAALRGDEATPEAIRGGIEDLLNKPDYQLSVGRIRKEMLAMPAPAAVVPELEALATSFSGRSQHVHA